LKRGRQVLLIEHGGIELDGFVFKNVVFRGVEVHYSGGPVQLDNVIFVNCVFIMENSPTQREFATAVLSNPHVTFSS
jgi:hypothetical protein